MAVIWLLAIIIALSIHEFSHALVANWLGDDTARLAGRLTLNPLKHLDPLGFLMLLFVGFGWGKPVPVNPRNVRVARWGSAIVAFAGPLANAIGVIVAGVALRVAVTVGQLPVDNLLVQFLALLVIVNLTLGLFNLIPIPPLDGSKFLIAILYAPKYRKFVWFLETRGPLVLLGLLVLDNLIGIDIFGRLFSGIINTVFNFIA